MSIPIPEGAPKEVHIGIDRVGWYLTNVETGRIYNVYPSQEECAKARSVYAQWTIGPVEVARILERLGIKVNITVERWER